MNKKHEIKFFVAWKEEKEKAYLEEMARKGWLLEGAKFVFYTFVQAEPAKYVYELDYAGSEDYKSKIRFYEELGWEHVSSQANWHYYRTKAENDVENLFYTDVKSYEAKYKPLVRVFITLAALNLFIGVLNLVNKRVSIVIVLISFIVALLLIYGVYRIQRRVIDFAIKKSDNGDD